jgi:NADPH:quinone reductase-like Zn-dependent oxidoreductase
MIIHRRQVVAEYTRRRKEGLATLSRLLQNGELSLVIDRRYPLKEIVEAHRYVEAGRKKGNVVVTVG